MSKNPDRNRKVRLNDVLRLQRSECQDLAELAWLLQQSADDHMVDTWTMLLGGDEEPSTDPSSVPQEIQTWLHQRIADLAMSQIFSLELSGSHRHELRNGRSTTVQIAGVDGATCNFFPTPNGQCEVTFHGLGANVRPLNFTFASVYAPARFPDSVQAELPLQWPKEALEEKVARAVRAKPAIHLTEIAEVLACQSEGSPKQPKNLKLGHLLLNSVQVQAKAAKGEVARAVSLTIEFTIDGRKMVHRKDLVLRASAEDQSKLVADYDVPFPAGAKLGFKLVTARELTPEELGRLAPDTVNELLANGPNEAVPLELLGEGKFVIRLDALVDTQSSRAMFLRYTETGLSASAGPLGLSVDDRAVKSAFNALFDSHYSAAYTYANRLASWKAPAEDILQQGVLNAYADFVRRLNNDSMEQIKSRFGGWLGTIMYNAACKIRGDRKRKPSHDDSKPIFSHPRNAILGSDFKAPSADAEFGGVIENEGDHRTLLPEEDAQRREDIQRMKEALGQLSSPERKVLELYYFEKLKLREISDETGIPMGTLGGLLNQSKRKLRDLLGDDDLAAAR